MERALSRRDAIGSSRNALRKASMMREHALAVLSEVLPWDSKRLALLPAYSLFFEFLAAFAPPCSYRLPLKQKIVYCRSLFCPSPFKFSHSFPHALLLLLRIPSDQNRSSSVVVFGDPPLFLLTSFRFCPLFSVPSAFHGTGNRTKVKQRSEK